MTYTHVDGHTRAHTHTNKWRKEEKEKGRKRGKRKGGKEECGIRWPWLDADGSSLVEKDAHWSWAACRGYLRQSTHAPSGSLELLHTQQKAAMGSVPGEDIFAVPKLNSFVHARWVLYRWSKSLSLSYFILEHSHFTSQDNHKLAM